MPFPERIGHLYDGVHVTGSAHLGDVYHHEPSPEERNLNAVLESLRYPGMHDRRDTLTEAHEGTFDWTFLEGETQFVEKRNEYGRGHDQFRTVNMNFKSWLHDTDEGMFCVTSKPGSGKSTFMKSLATSNDLTHILQKWAGKDVLLRADHFFWLLGAAMQKSLEGLLRSLICSSLLGLSQSRFLDKPEAIANICSHLSHINSHSAWSCKELKEILCRLASISGVKTFFLIDALDECEPQDKLDELAAGILWISHLPNVKLCVSHRPWAVFTRKFAHASILQLDRLTLHDMEVYIRGRLTVIEEEKGWHTDFGNQTQAAERFIHKVAHDAEGVFLWVELVVKAICSEMRKGKRLHQLDDIYLDFPTDLDDYFQKLIFGRIGRSNRNMKDTAAALKLAVMINTFEQSPEVLLVPYATDKSPFARSFVNFWLLSDERLKPDFSWQDHECIAQPCIEVMVNQTASFLEETCKDLLVLNRQTKEVDFMHRTVSDFLTDKKSHVALWDDAPARFSDGDFIFDLAKLRCICILRGARSEDEAALHALDSILHACQNVTHLDANASWLLTCESLTISEIQNALKDWSRQPPRYRDGMPGYCAKAGLSRVVLEVFKQQAFQALVHGPSHLDLLNELLQVTTNHEIRNPDLSLYRRVMEFGCNPNADIHEWPYLSSARYPFGWEEGDVELYWCRRTIWQAWLGEAYLQIQRRVSAARAGQIEKMLDVQRQWLGELVDLLLRYGADPHCTICIADHEVEPANERKTNCNYIALDRLLEQIVPSESIVQLQDLRDLCSDERISHVLRRNQQKRTMVFLASSEQAFPMLSSRYQTPKFTKERLRMYFLDALAITANFWSSDCERCSMSFVVALVTWCVECQALSSFCLDCALLRPSEVPGLIFPCNNFTIPHGSRNGDHTSVVFVWEDEPNRFRTNQIFRNNADRLHTQYPTDRAIATLKEWYAKNPIKPDLTFEEAIGGIATLTPSSGRHQTSEDDSAGGISASVHPMTASKRPRTGIEDFEVASKRHTAFHMPIATMRGSQEGFASEGQGESAALAHKVRVDGRVSIASLLGPSN